MEERPHIVKRFYKSVDVIPATAGDGHAVRLDARPIKTPARAPLTVPTLALADAIADEWRAQGDDILPATMPLTGIANAAIDHAATDPAAFAAPLAAYAGSDLFCYRDDRDSVLAAEQAAAWNPRLAWAEDRFGVEFTITAGILPVDQPPETVARLTAALTALDPFRLAAMAPLVTIGGSLVAALAIAEGPAEAETLWPVVTLDELFQERRWGEDAEASAMRARRLAEWRNAARFLSLV